MKKSFSFLNEKKETSIEYETTNFIKTFPTFKKRRMISGGHLRRMNKQNNRRKGIT